MGEHGLTSARILDAAEDVVRRFGPARATVVDVARALGVTHASVYRHFPSKAALRDAVVLRWLEAIMTPLRAVVAEGGPAPARLRRWLDALVAAKRMRAAGDPEVFAAYLALALQAREVVRAHVEELAEQAGRIIADGVLAGEFAADDPSRAGLAVLHATTRFHNPAHASEWAGPGIDDALEDVWSLILSGLRPRAPEGRPGPSISPAE